MAGQSPRSTDALELLTENLGIIRLNLPQVRYLVRLRLALDFKQHH